MGQEIERKFRVIGDDWRAQARGSERFRQGYLGGTHCSVRVRVRDRAADLNIKPLVLAVSRSEFEYPIPVDDAEQMLDELCVQPLIEKRRHFLDYAGHTWEIDEFEGANTGLVVAEIELEREDESFQAPPWLGKEVSHDLRYYNVRLVEHPYSEWADAD